MIKKLISLLYLMICLPLWSQTNLSVVGTASYGTETIYSLFNTNISLDCTLTTTGKVSGLNGMVYYDLTLQKHLVFCDVTPTGSNTYVSPDGTSFTLSSVCVYSFFGSNNLDINLVGCPPTLDDYTTGFGFSAFYGSPSDSSMKIIMTVTNELSILPGNLIPFGVHYSQTYSPFPSVTIVSVNPPIPDSAWFISYEVGEQFQAQIATTLGYGEYLTIPVGAYTITITTTAP